jgi:hypothetical protein
MTAQDKDAVGAISILRSLIQSVMPHDVLDCVDNKLYELRLSHLAIRNVGDGKAVYFVIPYLHLHIIRIWVPYSTWRSSL